MWVLCGRSRAGGQLAPGCDGPASQGRSFANVGGCSEGLSGPRMLMQTQESRRVGTAAALLEKAGEEASGPPGAGTPSTSHHRSGAVRSASRLPAARAPTVRWGRGAAVAEPSARRPVCQEAAWAGLCALSRTARLGCTEGGSVFSGAIGAGHGLPEASACPQGPRPSGGLGRGGR